MTYFEYYNWLMELTESKQIRSQLRFYVFEGIHCQPSLNNNKPTNHCHYHEKTSAQTIKKVFAVQELKRSLSHQTSMNRKQATVKDMLTMPTSRGVMTGRGL